MDCKWLAGPMGSLNYWNACADEKELERENLVLGVFAT